MVSENDLQIGDVLGGFKIEKILGRGGMGVVFKAHELSLNRKIALKVLASRLSANDEFLQRFRREAQVIAALKHPNIVNVLSYGQERGLHFFAMEYVQGKDLREVMRERPLVPLDEALQIVRQVADALSEAGAKGVVHRDIKPSNIMIDPMGRAYVTDFGVACFEEASEKLTQTGLFLGTPEYASPEQASGLSLDVRSDIYSLGAVLYRMVSGRAPVTGESPLAIVVKISTEPVTPISQVNPSIPQHICRLIDKMMAKEVDARYLSPKVLLDDVDRCIRLLKEKKDAAAASEDPFADTQPVLAKPKRRSMVGALGGILGIALAVFLVVWLVEGKMWRGSGPRPAAQPPVATPAATDAAPGVSSNVVQENGPADRQPAGGGATSNDLAVGPETAGVRSNSARDTQVAAAASPPVDTAEPNQKKSAPLEVDQRGSAARDRGASGMPAVAAAAKSSPAAPGREPIRTLQTPSGQSNHPPMLPENPAVLVIVSGDESMLPLTRSYLYAALRNSGLKILTYRQIPVLREKMLEGDMPISWYEVRQIAPPGRAQVLMMAEVIKTGTMPIHYMGRSDELVQAAITLQAMDLQTGESIRSSASDTVRFTAMNMAKKLKEGVSSAARGMQDDIRKYWQQKTGRRTREP